MNTLPALIPIPRSKELLGLPRTTVYKLANDGRLTIVKIATSSYITKDSAEAFIASLPTAVLRMAKVAA